MNTLGWQLSDSAELREATVLSVELCKAQFVNPKITTITLYYFRDLLCLLFVLTKNNKYSKI